MKLVPGLAAVVLATTTLATSAPAHADPAGDRAVSAGSAWLTAQLTDGKIASPYSEGLSADIAFALAAVGGHDATVTRIADAIEPVVDNWATGGDFAPDRVYAGSLAKAVAFVEVAGQDPTSYDGTDQVARLEGLVSSTAPLTGRLEDGGVDSSDPYDGDFVNVIGQSFAARALLGAGSDRAADATAFLLDQQCDAGFFRSSLNPDKADPDQGCVDGTDTGNVDATALAIINILDATDAPQGAKGAAYVAASWLRGQQAGDGSFSDPDFGANANTTGLAGWALAEAGQDAAAAKAAGWLRGLQVADLAPCATTLGAENGAVAYNAEALATAKSAGGISDATRGQFRRASAQALPVLAHVPAGIGTLGLSAPATAVEKTAVTVTVTGLGAGEPACVTLGAESKSVTGTGGDVDMSFTLPAGAADRTVSLATLGGAPVTRTIAVQGPAQPTRGSVKGVKVEGPAGFQQAGTTAAITVSGAPAGAQYLLRGPGIDATVVAGSDGVVTRLVALPETTTTAQYVLFGSDGQVADDTRVLGRKTFKLAVLKSDGPRTRVLVRGLEPGEKVRLVVAGRTLAKGRANDKGRYIGRVALPTDEKKVRVRAVGQFAGLRTGSTTVTR